MKILFVGPLPIPVTGQSICFKKIVDQYRNDQKIVVDNSKYKSKVLSAIYVYLQIILIFIKHSNKIECIYITCSRSLLGFLKDVPVLLLGKMLNVRIINHLHGSDFKSFEYNFPIKKLLHWLYNGVESIVLHESMKDQFSNFANMKIWVVPNFYDKSLDLYTDVITKNRGQILFLSNLMKSKGIIEFVENADQILKDPCKSIVIAGAFMGDKYISEKKLKALLKPEFQRLTNKYKNRFSYKGFVTGKEKIDLYSRSDIFILPSYSEGFPISIIEAMRLGCLIIATEVDYLPNIISQKNGSLIPFHDFKNIDKYIDKELSDQLLVSKKQRNNIITSKEKHSESSYIQNLKAIINYKG